MPRKKIRIEPSRVISFKQMAEFHYLSILVNIFEYKNMCYIKMGDLLVDIASPDPIQIVYVRNVQIKNIYTCKVQLFKKNRTVSTSIILPCLDDILLEVRDWSSLKKTPVAWQDVEGIMRNTRPKTNIVPENRPPQKEMMSFPTIIFQMLLTAILRESHISRGGWFTSPWPTNWILKPI